MNTYEIDIWRSVYHDGKYSHTATRVELIHALNENRAKAKITLAPEKTYNSGPSHTVMASKEVIYSIRKTGTVTIQPYYVYSDGRSPRPVKPAKRREHARSR